MDCSTDKGHSYYAGVYFYLKERHILNKLWLDQFKKLGLFDNNIILE